MTSTPTSQGRPRARLPARSLSPAPISQAGRRRATRRSVRRRPARRRRPASSSRMRLHGRLVRSRPAIPSARGKARRVAEPLAVLLEHDEDQPRPECAASGSATTSSASSVSAASAATRIARADGCRAGAGPARRAAVLTEDRPFELLQRRAGIDAELLDEHLSAVPVCLQRLGLPAGSIEREHELARRRSRTGARGAVLAARPRGRCADRERDRRRSCSRAQRAVAPRAGRSRAAQTPSYAKSTRAGPRHSDSAERRSSAARFGLAAAHPHLPPRAARIDEVQRSGSILNNPLRCQPSRRGPPRRSAATSGERASGSRGRLRAPEVVDQAVA